MRIFIAIISSLVMLLECILLMPAYFWYEKEFIPIGREEAGAIPLFAAMIFIIGHLALNSWLWAKIIEKEKP